MSFEMTAIEYDAAVERLTDAQVNCIIQNWNPNRFEVELTAALPEYFRTKEQCITDVNAIMLWGFMRGLCASYKIQCHAQAMLK